jgi:hypothetical protein
LLQESFRRETGQPPYRLYALSNLGSLLALLTYPFVFEPQLTLRMQILAWSAGYAMFGALVLWCAAEFLRVWRLPAAASAAEARFSARRPTAKEILLWLALAACGSVMLLATTNQLCQEVTSVPFLWVLPLSLYLFTFIICFDHERWYHRNSFVVLLAVAVLLACYAMFEGNDLTIWWQLAIYSATMFICCMVCHGELALSKPAPQHATLFYLMVAAGGALGGVLVAVVAPLVLRGFWEFHLGLVATVVLAFLASLVRSDSRVNIPRPVWLGGGAFAVALAIAIGLVVGREGRSALGIVESTRNFYGVLHVSREDSLHSDNGPKYELMHGTIQHGFQYLDPDKRDWPTTYYGPPSGVGLAIEHNPRRRAKAETDRTLRIGVVGLGCGTLAAYGKKGDLVRFYEINPEVIRLSDKYFTYRKDTPAEVDVVLGDARIMLERQWADGQPQNFDVLAIDAFSSDAIPMHLLTKESVELYLKHLKPDGMLCIHISNRFLDLKGVVLGIAQEVNMPCVIVETPDDIERGLNTSTWVVLTKNWEFLNDPVVAEASGPCWPDHGDPLVWTDDYGSLWQVIAD